MNHKLKQAAVPNNPNGYLHTVTIINTNITVWYESHHIAVSKAKAMGWNV